MVRYQLPAGKWSRMNLALSGELVPTPKALEKRIGGSNGFRGIPLDIINSSDYLGSHISWEQIFYHGSSFTWTVNAFGEAGIFSNKIYSRKKVTSFGLGVRMYIKKINIPALGFDAAHNPHEKAWFFSGSAGVNI